MAPHPWRRQVALSATRLVNGRAASAAEQNLTPGPRARQQTLGPAGHRQASIQSGSRRTLPSASTHTTVVVPVATIVVPRITS